ncbi:glycosyl hydrolases family 31-domain-containing protein [Gilbertella persicaria]|uniref:glycosyl hydrolases family 31-domain-containing protein n=1 Tax=Gilbertella persicaria TaxID=101096 RepID=UPI00221EF81B|nr:glycosyl hydrolases family 31-domain-containing protein [Gilbertella persicaria]KAI8083262.1 glycosyl hydrolases family 31-domain-containing protein [Gilbertella persicaria]
MWQSLLKNVGLSSTEDYIQPRLSIGNTVYDRPFSTGHFKIQVDAQALTVSVKNPNGRTIWRSLHNQPFLASSLGKCDIIPGENAGVFQITEHEEAITRLQTITKIERVNDSTIRIHGGLGTKLVLPTHMDYVFTFTEVSQRQLEFSAEILKRDSVMEKFERLILIYESRPEEHFYGFGEQFSYASLKGCKVPILVREQGAGRGALTASSFKDSAFSVFGGYNSTDSFATYASIPQYISSDIRCLFMENTEYMSFDMTLPDRVTIRLESDKMKGRILDGKTMLDLITEYTSYAGRMQPLPDWVSDGIIAGIQGGKEKTTGIIQKLRAYNVPLAAVFLQDWTGARLQETGRGVSITHHWWNWESADELYPEWSAFVESLNNDNVRVISYVNPLLSNPQGKRQVKRNLFEEANKNGYLVKSAQSNSSEQQALMIKFGTYVEAAMLDLTNPEARTWFKSVLKDQFWSKHISGMMVDFGEHLPYGSDQVILHSGEKASTYHNKYPVEWAQLIQEVVQDLGKQEEALCFFRSAYTCSQSNMNLFWAGDQNVTWDQHYGIKSAIIGMLSGGFSGLSVTHCDAGGYNTVLSNIPGFKMARTKELLFRWLELSACTPAFRTSEGIIPSLNAQFYDDEDTYIHLAHTAKIFTLIAAYRKTVLKEAYEYGWPVMRHPVLYYPNDKTARELTYNQFMLGSSMMVAPVLAPSATYVKVYFPKDAHNVVWRHIWSGKYYNGDGTYKAVDAPLGQPAIFVKEPRSDEGLLNSLLDYATTYYQNKLQSK